MTLTELFSTLQADFARLYAKQPGRGSGAKRLLGIFNPRFHPVILLRLAFYFRQSRLLAPLSFIFTWTNVVVFGIECTARCEIGPGLLLPHSSGTVIGASRVGAHATIFQGVTLGAKHLDLGFNPDSRPSLGDHVIVGAGAKVLGGICIGDHATIGANAVVLKSVPPLALAVGNPAIIKQKTDESAG